MASPLPKLYTALIDMGCLTASSIHCTPDHFYTAATSLAEILDSMAISTFPGSSGQILECRNFFDDWYLYAVPGADDYVYSMFKLREQEYDLEQGLEADGDTPGVTVSFISFRTDLLLNCLLTPILPNRKALADEINRVVAYPRQSHDPHLKAYFIRPEAQGAYLIATLYVRHIASFAHNGFLPVPDHYTAAFQASIRPGASSCQKRVPGFLEENNQAAGRLVCDHKKIYIQNSRCLSEYEKLALLATHTGNTSVHSFAAEIRFHALFLIWYAKIPLPFVGGSAYASAIRADLSIQDREFQGPTPYYHPESRLMKEQLAHHGTASFMAL